MEDWINFTIYALRTLVQISFGSLNLGPLTLGEMQIGFMIIGIVGSALILKVSRIGN